MKKLNPAGHRVIIRPDKLEEEKMLDQGLDTLKQAGFSINKPYGQEKRERVGTDKGVVVAVGPTAWKLEQYGNVAWAKVGDYVMFGRYAGKVIEDPETGEELMVINDDDIQAVITEE